LHRKRFGEVFDKEERLYALVSSQPKEGSENAAHDFETSREAARHQGQDLQQKEVRGEDQDAQDVNLALKTGSRLMKRKTWK
jgi:hypothetical protein